MSTPRSPKYPSIPLDQAVDLATQLWEREKKTPVSADLVGKAWGYKGDSGPVRAKIGSLRQYGLLDGTKDGVKVSDLAIEIIVHEKGSGEKALAMELAALNPPLFSELFESHKHASPESLRAFLITKRGFNPDAANQFVSSFRATIAFVDSASTAYNAPSAASSESVPSAAPIETKGKPLSPPTEAVGSLFLKVPFRGSELSVRIESGQTLTKEHLARVVKYLELAKDDLADGKGESE